MTDQPTTYGRPRQCGEEHTHGEHQFVDSLGANRLCPGYVGRAGAEQPNRCPRCGATSHGFACPGLLADEHAANEAYRQRDELLRSPVELARRLDKAERERDEARQRADQGEARGYRQAIDELRGVTQRTGSPAARWAADYLEAVGPDGTAGLQAAVDGPEGSGVDHTTNPGRTAPEWAGKPLTCTTAETGQDGAGVGGGCGEADAGGSGT